MEVLDDVVAESQLLLTGSLLEAPLHDAASVLVHANIHAVGDAGVEDEVGVLGGLSGTGDVLVLRPVGSLELDQEGLDDVIAMHVHD